MRENSDRLIPADLRDIEKRRAAARARLRDLPPMTDEEDEAITEAALTDPDAQPMSEEALARMRPAQEVVPDLVARELRRGRGRPKLERPKEKHTIRLDADVVAYFRASGDKWQTRINEILREAAFGDKKRLVRHPRSAARTKLRRTRAGG